MEKETFIHEIEGVKVTVSKTEDGKYLLSGNDKCVTTEDSSFYQKELSQDLAKILADKMSISYVEGGPRRPIGAGTSGPEPEPKPSK